MPIRFLTIILVSIVATSACKSAPGSSASNGSNRVTSDDAQTAAASSTPEKTQGERTPNAVVDQPKTIRDFYMLLPEKYFVLEGCDRAKDKDCGKAKVEYLKTFAEIEDTANGYLKAGCDGAQSCLEMAIFRRPDMTYMIAVATESEMITNQYFLDYKGGQWSDISASVIPEFSKRNIYELPRQGTTVKVFAKSVTEKGDDYEIAEKGAKLYDLVWKDGKFSIKK